MSNLTDPKLMFLVPHETIRATLAFLQAQGRKPHEGVVLWTARLHDDACTIVAPLIPAQVTGPLSYRIPDEETFRILDEVNAAGLVIPIQVHSHPRQAFHSPVDDERAFVQHRNGISIVVPNFGSINGRTFFGEAKTFRLASDGSWHELSPQELLRFRIT